MKLKLVSVLDPKELYTNEDLCIGCKYEKSFLCDKKYADGMLENYFKQYDIKIYVYYCASNNLQSIIKELHVQEVKHHRNREYFALQCTNFHCGHAVECECAETRCWHFDKVPSRHQPHCIKFFGIKIPQKYSLNQYIFILGNSELNEEKK